MNKTAPIDITAMKVFRTPREHTPLGDARRAAAAAGKPFIAYVAQVGESYHDTAEAAQRIAKQRAASRGRWTFATWQVYQIELS